jgi:IclR family transcriptional regulator, KDG regulon repressor
LFERTAIEPWSTRLARRSKGTQSPPAAKDKHESRSKAALRQSDRHPVDKTLTKGLHLLETLSESEESRGMSELAHELSLTKSNVHRLLQTLIRCGYVAREARTERYLLSSKLWQISRRGKPFDALRRLVRPALRSLVLETGESVVFTVVEDDELVLIDQVETQSPVRVFFSVGQSFPIDQVVMQGKGLTALQLVVLASRPQIEARTAARNVQKQLRKGEDFIDQLLSQISEVRENGFALSRGEWVSGVNAVAVPVADGSHGLIGVLSCFGPADRVTASKLAKIEKMLRRKAHELSRLLRE